MQSRNGTAGKIIKQLKGLGNHLLPGEEPLFTVPAIWDSGQERGGVPCDVVVTNQRIFGYYYVTFPRERLFLDALNRAEITAVTFRQKTFEPVFRELLVSDGQHKVYIRAPRKKLERLYEAMQSAIERHGSQTQPAVQDEGTEPAHEAGAAFGKQEIHTTFERSPLAITLLFMGGLALEILGIGLWITTQSSPTGLPLIVAGFIAVITAFLVRRQR